MQEKTLPHKNLASPQHARRCVYGILTGSDIEPTSVDPFCPHYDWESELLKNGWERKPGEETRAYFKLTPDEKCRWLRIATQHWGPAELLGKIRPLNALN